MPEFQYLKYKKGSPKKKLPKSFMEDFFVTFFKVMPFIYSVILTQYKFTKKATSGTSTVRVWNHRKSSERN